MNSVQVTAQQLAQFREAGYTVFPTFFDATELTAMLVELERFKRDGLGRNVATDGDGKTHSTTKVNYQIIPLNNKSTLFRAFPFNEKVVDVVGQLIGTAILAVVLLQPAIADTVGPLASLAVFAFFALGALVAAGFVVTVGGAVGGSSTACCASPTRRPETT